MTIIKFRVEGLPPKKNGANSMWGKPHEAEKLVSLRKEALQAFKGRPPLKKNIKLAVTGCVGAKNDRSVGDLDTFMTGVCDGLMKRAAGCKLCPTGIWEKPSNNDIHPDIFAAIDDDCQVIGIKASKITDDAGKQYYDVELEGD